MARNRSRCPPIPSLLRFYLVDKWPFAQGGRKAGTEPGVGAIDIDISFPPLFSHLTSHIPMRNDDSPQSSHEHDLRRSVYAPPTPHLSKSRSTRQRHARQRPQSRNINCSPPSDGRLEPHDNTILHQPIHTSRSNTRTRPHANLTNKTQRPTTNPRKKTIPSPIPSPFLFHSSFIS